ncbi:hypothetical protein FO519_010145, partial [Halicephalobus sp. NKZ332]
TDIYIGLYRDTTDPVGTMHWTDGTSVNYSTWTGSNGFTHSEKIWTTLVVDPVAGQYVYKKFNAWYPTSLPTARGFVCKKQSNEVPQQGTSNALTPVCLLGSTPSSHDPTFCYFVVNETNTFESAESLCQAHNAAHLPKINDLFTNVYIGNLARSNGFDNIWIGATDTIISKGETCSNWYWTSGNQLLSFTDWAPSEPSSGDCAMLSVKDGYYWHSQNCNTFLPTICQLPAVYSICDPDWNYFNVTQMCYKTFINPLSFDDSEAYCQARGAYLVSIHSQEENEFVVDISKSGVVVPVKQWPLVAIRIGLYRLNTDPSGFWQWTDGTNVTYTNWDPAGGVVSDTRFVIIWSDPISDVPRDYKTWYASAPTDLPLARGFVCKKSPMKIQ